MKMSVSFFSSATRILLAALFAAVTLPAQAAAIVSLKGTTQEVRQGGDAEVRLSVLSFNDAETSQAFVERYREYQGNQDHAAFATFIKEQQTRGYVFSKGATGYTIKYAWQDPADNGRMVFVVTPALKTLNPYLWKTRNDSAAPFTVLETRMDGDAAVLKTSVDTTVEITADNSVLQLQGFAAAPAFAVMKDDRPYYLKQDSALKQQGS
jgi:opacity protein-like surface antigen